MLPLLQVVDKNEILKRSASIFLEKMFVKYGIDQRTIVYADLRPLFKNATGFIIQKFELDKKLSKEDLKEFRGLCGAAQKAAPKTSVTMTTPVPPKAPVTTSTPEPVPPKPHYPINKSKGTGKTK